jgi:hypothetical protein
MRRIVKTMRLTVTGSRLVLAAVVLAWPTLAPARDTSLLDVASKAVPADPGASARPAPFVPLASANQPQGADFLGEIPSKETRRVANWVVATGDNDGLPFVIIDKIGAKVLVFDSVGRLRGATFALLGKARGDDTVPGIGSRKLSTIRPEERTTPAGRFVAFLGRDFHVDILWIDYDDALSLHRVVTGNPSDHRSQRLATTSPLDKRISYGCINVPVRFYDEVVLKAFTGTKGIVYILPEIKTIQDVFGISEGGDGPIGNGARRSLPRLTETR